MATSRKLALMAMLGAGAALMVLALIIDPGMLVRAPQLGVRMLGHRSSAPAGLAVLLAVSANLAPFLPLPRALYAAYLVTPWLPLAAARVSAHMTPAAFARLAPSYAPWAASITLLLVGRLLTAAPRRRSTSSPPRWRFAGDTDASGTVAGDPDACDPDAGDPGPGDPGARAMGDMTRP